METRNQAEIVLFDLLCASGHVQFAGSVSHLYFNASNDKVREKSIVCTEA